MLSLLTQFFLIITLPSIGLLFFKTQSLAPGLLIAIFISFFAKKTYSKESLIIAFKLNFFLILILSTHFFITGILNDSIYSTSKFTYSLFAFVLLIISSCNLTYNIWHLDNKSINKVVNFLYITLSVEAFLAIFGLPAIADSNNALPIIFYSEPSHFSLVFLPFLYFKLLADSKYKYFHLLNALIIALLIKSTILLAGIIIILPVIFSFYRFFFSLIAIFITVSFFDYNYFLERIALNGQITNTSALIFMSAYERAFNNFLNTNYLGLGFQQLNINSYFGKYQEVINNYYGLLNIEDAGVTFSKLISELGFIGFLLIFIYFLTLYKALKLLKQNKNNFIYLFFFALLFSSLIEIFLRGVGYFSPGIFFLFLAMIYFNFYEKKDTVF